MNVSSDLIVAVVEDESSLRETLEMALRREGLTVLSFPDGMAAWEHFEKKLPDLMILDILMPRMDGLELCRRVRGIDEIVPIIFLSSRDEELDRVLGLELGADDYLCKPFSMRELIARVRVLLRRLTMLRQGIPTQDADVLRSGSLEMDMSRYEARLGDAALNLTLTEFQMLRALVRSPGRVKTRGQLMQEGYPYDAWVSERTIDTHIKRLRRKLEEADPEFDRIETVYGLGYRLRDH